MSEANGTCALLTGGTGYVGGRLARRLRDDGWNVHAIVRPGSVPATRAALGKMLGEDHVHTHDGTMEGMSAIVQGVRPTIIFHVAAKVLAQHSPADLSGLVRSNIEFGAQLAEAGSVHGLRQFINTGTAWQHFGDADYNPVNLYAATKQAMADLLRFYAEAGTMRITNLELFDTYGPDDPRQKFFALLRDASASGQTLAMTAGEQWIDVVYIDDVVDAYVAAARAATEPEAPFETFAVSSGRPMPLREVVALWQRVAQRSVRVNWGAKPYRPREVMRPWNRGQPLPGWKARIDLEEGIRRMERGKTECHPTIDERHVT
jgi:nucleoside-diphosphate-sugar epimerase